MSRRSRRSHNYFPNIGRLLNPGIQIGNLPQNPTNTELQPPFFKENRPKTVDPPIFLW